jgi:hypothetical protein
LSMIAAGPAPVAAEPAHPHLVAWCGTRKIDVSVNGTVHLVSVGGVPDILRRLHGLIAGRASAGLPTCDDVIPLSSTTLLAAFPGGLAQDHDAMPPVVDYGLETRNDGKTWASIPAPRGARPADFGGFRAIGKAALVIYAGNSTSGHPPAAVHPIAERTTDDGRSWTPVRLSCPARGPCVTLGPFQQVNCAMGFAIQYVLRSSNGGLRWQRSPILDSRAFACGDAQLVAISRRAELLVNALSAYPLQLSRDAGADWSNVSLPPISHLAGPMDTLNDFGPGGITLLPDGALLLTGAGGLIAYGDYTGGGGWQLLAPGARHWCAVAGYTGTWQFAPQASRITVIGTDLWWLTYGSSDPNRPTSIRVHELPLSAVRCV